MCVFFKRERVVFGVWAASSITNIFQRRTMANEGRVSCLLLWIKAVWGSSTVECLRRFRSSFRCVLSGRSLNGIRNLKAFVNTPSSLYSRHNLWLQNSNTKATCQHIWSHRWLAAYKLVGAYCGRRILLPWLLPFNSLRNCSSLIETLIETLYL